MCALQQSSCESFCIILSESSEPHLSWSCRHQKRKCTGFQMWVSHSFSPSFLIDAHSLTSTSLCGRCTPIACPLCCSCVPACYCIPCVSLQSAGIAVRCPGCNIVVYISCRWTSHCKFMHCPFISRYHSTSLMSLRRSWSRSAHCGAFWKQAQEIWPSTQSVSCAPGIASFVSMNSTSLWSMDMPPCIVCFIWKTSLVMVINIIGGWQDVSRTDLLLSWPHACMPTGSLGVELF